MLIVKGWGCTPPLYITPTALTPPLPCANPSHFLLLLKIKLNSERGAGGKKQVTFKQHSILKKNYTVYRT